ncbi:hypothetical protein JCM17960_09240 [Magnetospira thiophila]
MTPRRLLQNPWFPALLFAAALCLLGPWWGVYEMDTDEGLNLMKAFLVAEGHHLYGEIWSDQPPVLTLVLAAVQQLFGPSVIAARATILLFSVLLLGALFRIVQREEGTVAAWVAVACLVSTALYQRLSVSVMIGLPALALALLALDQALGAAGRWQRQALSGFLMALSLQTKFFTLVLLPALLLAFWIDWRRRDALPGRRAGFAWIIAFCLTFGGLTLLAGPAFVSQLIAPHVQPGLAEAFPYDQGSNRFWPMLLEQPYLLTLAVLGLLLAWPWRRPSRWIPGLWVGMAGVVLYRHAPLWNHQLLLILIPLSWLAGMAGGALHSRLRDVVAGRRWAARALALALLGGGLWQFMVQGQQTVALFHRPTDANDRNAVAALSERAGRTRWLITDRPMDAYYARLPVVPPLAVYSLKRVRGGLLTPEQVVEILKTYQPEQVSYRRFYMGRAVQDYLSGPYEKLPGLTGQLLYIRKDLLTTR